ncbi:MAG: DUF1871 family protein [Clostridia bacterium]
MKYDKIKEIIDCWDPIDLLSYAPHDEYNYEIEKIANLISNYDDEKVVGEIIYKVFMDSFGQSTFLKNRYDCIVIAKKIVAFC